MSERRRVISARSSWVQIGFGAAEMEEEFHHVELLMRKQPSLRCPPPEACVSQPKWYVVYSTEEKNNKNPKEIKMLIIEPLYC